jgi:branched-chain amino acid transport system permease protein
MVVVGLALFLMWRIVQSPFGFALRNIRDNQRRTAFLGINVRAHMLVNFVTAGAFAGIAGALWAPFQRSVAPGLLGWQESGIAVFMTLIGGTKFFIGPIVGSIVYTFLHAWVTIYTVYWPLTIGLIILFIVLFAPGGVLGFVAERIARRAATEAVTKDNAVSDADRGAGR